MPLRRIIITGANGAGKSYVAAQLAALRPDVTVVSFDALKLTTDWQRRPQAETEQALNAALEADEWILEGGPSMLHLAGPHADALIWLDPPLYVRTWRLLVRPLRHLGRTRSELPSGNVDWPFQQYRFAFSSLCKNQRFRRAIAQAFEDAPIAKWHCRARSVEQAALKAWAQGHP